LGGRRCHAGSWWKKNKILEVGWFAWGMVEWSEEKSKLLRWWGKSGIRRSWWKWVKVTRVHLVDNFMSWSEFLQGPGKML
jgi:hypothetical protein